MTVRERIVALRLISESELNAELFDQIGLTAEMQIKSVTTGKNKTDQRKKRIENTRRNKNENNLCYK